jgi:hypothetical protein
MVLRYPVLATSLLWGAWLRQSEFPVSYTGILLPSQTTMAAFAADHLPATINGIRPAVASISITQHVWSTSLNFVEDLFQLVHSSFCDESSADFEAYRLACQDGEPVTERIQNLIAALSTACPNTYKFLILDGYDCINEALQSVIDVHFSALQLSGLKVMTTRRVPSFSIPHNKGCDECAQEYLELWWECSECKEFDLCYDCKKKDVLDKVHVCQITSLRETYQHVSIKLGDFSVECLIEKRLRMHHRDVGLETIERIVAYVSSKAGGNITLALLYLEDVFTWNDVSNLSLDRVDDRLPRDVIAYFDTEMKFIERQPEPQRLPPLLAIAAAADYNYTHNVSGIPLKKLEECIRLSQIVCSNLDYPRSVGDIFIAANGWLTGSHTQQREVDICCKPAFTLYAEEDYNESLAWAKRQIGSSAERESGAVALKQSQETSPPLETPGLLGSTFDTLASDAPLPTPLGSLNDGLGIRQLGDGPDGALFLNKGERMVQSPPRLNSFENLPKSTLAILSDEHLSRITNQTNKTLHRPAGRVCNFCASNMLGSNASSGQHQGSYRDARASIDHCIFCSSLYPSAHSDVPSSHDDWPLYHWTLRALPRGRELKGSMMLRFWSSRPTLATKAFRFLPGTDLHVPSSMDLHESTDPMVSGGAQIKEWMETCMRGHSGCSKIWNDQRSDIPSLPTRLIDVDTGDENVVRLIDTKITKAKGPYCTLSHAWGPPEKAFLTTTVWNMAKHLIAGIKLHELPPNFQQAIQVTRFLKVRYIWIDSLVIVQEPYGDFAKEADLMHKVYRQSYCNIVAADSMDGYGGLFRRREPHDILPVEYQGTGANHHLGERTWTVVPANLWEKELLSSDIYSRGWVFQGEQSLQLRPCSLRRSTRYVNRHALTLSDQERILSPRLIHFTRHQIFWDCGTLSACEVFPSGLPFPLDHKASTDRHWRGRLVQSTVPSNALSGVNDNESSYTFWISAVQNYTECKLTNQADKTIAIWSIAKLLRDFMAEPYAAGMWSQSLHEQLAWRVRDIGASERTPELQVNIPSWSWASVNGPVVPQHRLAIRSYKVMDHSDADIRFTVDKETKDDDKEPKLESKALALKAYVNVGRLISVQDNVHRLRVAINDFSDTIEMESFPDAPLATTGIDPEQCVFIILAASAISHNVRGLHLTKPSPLEPAQTYTGIGLLLTTHSAWFAHQEHLYGEYKSKLAGLEPSRAQKWRLDSFEKLMLEQQKKTVKTNERVKTVYRRIGALQFRDLDEQAFKLLTNGQRLKEIWLE